MNTEYHRLGGHLPVELLDLINEYAQPLYRKPSHYSAYSPLLYGMKMVIVSNALKRNYPQRREFTHDEFMKNHNHRTRLLAKQTGDLFEEIESSRNMLVDIRAMIKSERASRKNLHIQT